MDDGYVMLWWVVGQEIDGRDRLGKYEEDKFRMGLDRQLRPGQARTIHFTLKGGRKVGQVAQLYHQI